MHLVLCGKLGKKSKLDCDLQVEKLENIKQWAETIFDNSN